MVDGEMRFKVAHVDELKPGQSKAVRLNNKTIALFNVKGKYYALDDVCSHMGAPLASGMIAGKTVTCEWHGATFDLETGEGLEGPVRGDVAAYKVYTEGEFIEIEMDE